VPPLLGGRYRLDKLIGGGGMGEVWEAHDDVLDRLVAIKIIRPHLADDENVRARLRVEAQLAGKLHHPGIVDVFDYGEDQEDGKPVPYLVMPLIDGAPLSALLAERGALSTGETMAIVSEIAAALHVAHEAGLVHRDLKPGNILVTTDGRVMLVDFGIAHAAGREPLTQTGAVIGTADYLSPEQARGDTATFASDLYALGIVAYTCLSGNLPFHRDSDIATALAHLQSDPPVLPDTVPEEAATLVNALLAKDPGARPSSGTAVAERAGVLATSVPSPPGHAPVLSGEPTMPHASVPGSTLPGIVERPVSVGAPDDDPATLIDIPTRGSVVAAEHAQHRHSPRRMVLLSSAVVVLAAAAVLGWVLIGRGTETVAVPNVEGKSQSTATSLLKAAGLKVDVHKVNVANAKAGEVVRQTPTGGSKVDKDSTVTLSVATGRVHVPEDKLVGTTYDEAVALLDRLGLKADPTFATSEEAAGTVIAVDPTGTARNGSTVTLTVSDGPPQEAPTDKGKGKKDEKKQGSGKSSTPTESTPTPAPTTTSPSAEPPQ
jgi:serine/threonine protein kinase/beta-lactam-binding protein with PASTA domain